MPVKVSVGLSRKVGQPDYSSLGASCHVEFELDGSYDNGSTARFQDAVRRAYVACRDAVEAELASQSGANTSPDKGSRPQASEDPHQSSHRHIRKSTISQIRAIKAISKSKGIDLPDLLQNRYQITDPYALSLAEASELIDYLKNKLPSNSTVGA